ncbi:MFS transporter [Staphylococcus simiae]|uniref:MFS transporter n=1 Tax=Staphylococcus simiae TaxID=308354 RepID=UPI001A9679B9|nr:MFS transporter [Staphylococcus simiae]MBO1199423.1 MFS transporter [Staphylococcus simiae]MBO1201884.1 MFS transporter [Staphylococcus simiae]MBO1204098.1 MFS transporter [Staphylococcus simiae]MBO1211135.1 MFS transporter [Staphylococcus simiae]MBO1230333.1 MFS transporter [Staphylococcus simiae]
MEHSNVPNYQGGNKLITAIMLAILTYWLFGQSFLNIGPHVQQTYQSSAGIINIAISLTSLFTGVFMVTAGGFADRFGRVKIMRLGLVLSIIGSILIIITHSSWLLLVGRAVQGFSAACLMPATISLINTYYYGNARHRAMSFWSMGSYGGTGLASLLAGSIATAISWQWIFIISIIVTLISFYLLRDVPEVKEDSHHNTQFDFLGLLLFIIFMLSLNVIISMGNQIGWLSATTLLLALLFIISLYGFIMIEKRRQDPFIDFSLFSSRFFIGTVIANFLMNTTVGTLALFNIFAQQNFNISGLYSGFLTIPYMFGVLITIRIGERMMRERQAKIPMMIGSGFVALGMLFIGLTVIPFNVYIFSSLFGFLLFGMGLGFFATPGLNTAVSNAPSEKVGIASGIYKMVATIGAAFGITIFTSLYNMIKASSSMTIAAMTGFLLCMVFVIIAIFITKWIIPNKQ